MMDRMQQHHGGDLLGAMFATAASRLFLIC